MITRRDLFGRLRWAVPITLTLLTGSAAAQTADPPSLTSLFSRQASQEQPPLPPHTGWASLAKDTAEDVVIFPQRKSTWILLAGGAVAALAVHPLDDDVQNELAGNETAKDFFVIGKWLGHTGVQFGTAGGLWLIGRWIMPPGPNGSRTNKVSHLGFDLLRAELISAGFVYGMKQAGRRDRPTGECCSFPSGHATNAFAFASVIERHFGRRGSFPALAMAAYVGTSRLVDNRHWLSDVVFGAALGEAIGWTVVGRHGRKQFALQPVPVPGGLMLAFVREARE